MRWPPLPLLTSCLLTGCSDAEPPPRPPPAAQPPAPDEEAEEAEEPVEAELVSPSDGAELTVPWVPLSVRLPEVFARGEVAVLLDGEPWQDPLHILRSRWTGRGGGADYLATLELGELAPGPHELVLTFTARDGEQTRTLRSGFTWARPPCPVELQVVDEAGEAVPARIVLLGEQGPHSQVSEDQARVDPMGRDTGLHSIFTLGRTRTWLPHGHFTLLASRGIRHELGVAELELGADCEALTPVQLVVREAVPTPSQLTADLHVHTAWSGDSFVPDRKRFESLAAADLDLVVLTDHKRIRPGEHRAALAAPGLRTWAGTEFKSLAGDVSRKAHHNAFPLVQGGRYPRGKKQPAAQVYDRWRQRQLAHPHPEAGERVLIQLNHPRSIKLQPGHPTTWNGYALFGPRAFDRTVPVGQGGNAWMTLAREGTGTTALDFDLLEVLNRFSWEHYLQVRADWFVLNDLGRFPTGTGNSDTHALTVELAGFPVNLVRSGPSTDQIVAALAEGRVSVSTGPVLELQVEGGRPGDTVQGTALVAELTVRAASWVPVQELRLVHDGVVVFRETLPQQLPPEGHRTRVPLSPSRDGWVLAEVGPPLEGPLPTSAELGPYARIAPGYVPLAFTNPVRIDAEGDGVWTPLSPLEAAARAALHHPMPETD